MPNLAAPYGFFRIVRFVKLARYSPAMHSRNPGD
jgi:hypothetical protein